MGCGASKAVGDKPPAADKAGATTSVRAIDAVEKGAPASPGAAAAQTFTLKALKAAK